MNALKRFKGEIMKKHYLRIVTALIAVAGLGIVAKGQVVDQIVVNIPYEFVVAGKTLPAGTYGVKRVNDADPRALLLSSFGNHASPIVVVTQVETSDTHKAEVSFEQVGNQHFLSKIETANHLFTIPISRSQILEAAARTHNGTSASGNSSGSN
jgi:hypothetical protein